MWSNIKSSLKFGDLFQQMQHEVNLQRYIFKVSETVASFGYVYIPMLAFQFRPFSNCILNLTVLNSLVPQIENFMVWADPFMSLHGVKNCSVKNHNQNLQSTQKFYFAHKQCQVLEKQLFCETETLPCFCILKSAYGRFCSK